MLLNSMQRPGWLRHTAEIVLKGFKEKYKWWATVELGRRVLLLLFIVPFPGNDVSNMLVWKHTYMYIICISFEVSIPTLDVNG